MTTILTKTAGLKKYFTKTPSALGTHELGRANLISDMRKVLNVIDSCEGYIHLLAARRMAWYFVKKWRLDNINLWQAFLDELDRKCLELEP